jgi:hypothetical protein
MEGLNPNLKLIKEERRFSFLCIPQIAKHF